MFRKGGVKLHPDREYTRKGGQWIRVKKKGPGPKQCVVYWDDLVTHLAQDGTLYKTTMQESATTFDTASEAKKAIHKTVEANEVPHSDFQVVPV